MAGFPAENIEALDAQLRADGRMVVRTGRTQLITELVASLALGAISLAGLIALLGSSNPNAVVIAICVIAFVFFALIALPIAGYELFTGRPNVVVTWDGIAMGDQYVSWDHIDDVRLRKLRRAQYVVLDAWPEIVARFAAQRTWKQPIATSSRFTIRGDSLCLPPSLTISPEELREWLTHLWARRRDVH